MSLSREQMLLEMGIAPLWRWRDPAGDGARQEGAVAPAAETPVPADAAHSGAAPDTFAVPENQPVSQPTTARAPQPVSSGDVATLDWEQLGERVAACNACVLCQQRRQAVLGVGDRQPDWLFVGEGPGAEEDARGEPFVGQAGKLLDNMLAALDIARGNKVYIANAVKCRPPGNRTPEAGEMAACRPYLERQVALLKPKIIVLLGKAAVHAVLHEDKSLASMRGRVFEYAGVPVVVTYHPAYLLRNLPDKAKAWEDLLFARRTLAGENAQALPL